MLISLLTTLVKFFKLLFSLKLKMPKDFINRVITIKNDKYLIFRHIVVKENRKKKEQAKGDDNVTENKRIKEKKKETEKDESPVILVLRFQFHYKSIKRDYFVSFFQIPVFAGMPGFQAKLWTYDIHNNYFQGVYQWKSLKYANDYLSSYAVDFVKRKARKNTVSYIIYENMNLNFFMNNIE